MSVSSRISQILPALLAKDGEEAWDDFLVEFAPLILQVVHLFERDQDRVDDCFVFVCEQLKRGDLKRIRRFETGRDASFPTWLRAVVRNLCLDWRRKRFGRPRIFRSIARLPELDREVFRCVHLRRQTENETLHTLQALYPSLTRPQLAESLVRIQKSLNRHQSWLLASYRPRTESLSVGSDSADDSRRQAEPADPGTDPERDTAGKEILFALRSALDRLPQQQRLLLRLRYEQELTLDQIANLTRLGSSVTVQRIIQDAMATMRRQLSATGVTSVSVKEE